MYLRIFIAILILSVALILFNEDSSNDSNSVIDTSTKQKEISKEIPKKILKCVDSEGQPQNGYSPYDSYFGKGIYNNSTDNTLIINTPKSSNTVFLLKDIYSGKVIRNEYIRKNSRFSLTGIPYGTYEFSYFSGNAWSGDLNVNNGKIKGGFTCNKSFSKNENANDRMDYPEGYYGTNELTLTQVVNGNLETESINESEFFN